MLFALATSLGACGSTAEEPPAAALCSPESPDSPAPLRRLTRFEYGRSVRDLTGVNPAIAERLPPDEESFGFSNNADAYSISTLHASKYLEVAEEIAEHFVSDEERLASIAECQPLSDAACVEPFLRAFGRRVFRRPLTEDELGVLLDVQEATADPSPREGLTAAVATLLQAPQFLYRPEGPAAEGDASASVDPYTLATRLSYLLVATTPDDALLEAAADGSLETPEGLAAETERLLERPEALEAFTHFLDQWWEFESLSTLEKDRTLVRGWTSSLPQSLAEEMRHFVADAWHRGLTLQTLLRAPYTFVNAELATYYGIRGPDEPGYHRVDLDPARASGLLTQGALLATHAKADQTSPVDRGKFVRARLFCDPPPPPPPTIVVAPPTVNPRLSTRERFRQHVADPSCSGCHRFMDPIGFAFEAYDAGGRWRDTDAGEPVDTTGELVGTDVDGAIDGVPDLAERLLQSADVRHCVATQWFRYAFGRSEQSEHDACTIDALDGTLAREGGDLRAMVRATVQQPLFRQPPPGELDP